MPATLSKEVTESLVFSWLTDIPLGVLRHVLLYKLFTAMYALECFSVGLRRWLVRILIVGVPLLVLGCGGSSDGETDIDPDRPSICFSYQDLETEFWEASHRIIVETLREENIQVIERNAHEDVNRQLEQVRTCMAQGVDGIIFIPQDGESALTIIGEANKKGIPIGTYNRQPASREGSAHVVVADNERIAEKTVAYLAEQARAQKEPPIKPLVMVGDLGDQNAVKRRQGFYNVIERNPELFSKPVEVPTKWSANTALSNLEAALQSNPDVDLIFTSSDFLLPQIRAVLRPLGKWKKRGESGHVLLGGLDGDMTACRMMRDGYVDATGVQDLFKEAEMMVDTMITSIENGQTTPDSWIRDEGWALTQDNMADRASEMWGCQLLDDEL